MGVVEQHAAIRKTLSTHVTLAFEIEYPLNLTRSIRPKDHTKH
jgi:hypothetical protein